MAKGYLNKFINWLAHARYMSTGSNFVVSGTYGTVVPAQCQLGERCGIVSVNLRFTLRSSVSVSATGSITSPSAPFQLGNLVTSGANQAGWAPLAPVPFSSRGSTFQFFGYIDTDGAIYVTGGQARGSAYTINSGYQVNIGATFVNGKNVLTTNL